MSLPTPDIEKLRPIGAAPKDGTQIILHCAWEPLTVVGYWGPATCPGENHSDEITWRVAWDQARFDDGYEATHWAPLLDSLPSPVSVGDAREIAREIAVDYDGDGDTWLVERITAALLSAESRGERNMRERAAQVAYGRCGVGETASHLGASIGDDIRAIPLEVQDV